MYCEMTSHKNGYVIVMNIVMNTVTFCSLAELCFASIGLFLVAHSTATILCQ